MEAKGEKKKADGRGTDGNTSLYTKQIKKMRDWLYTLFGLVEYILVSFAFQQVHRLLAVRK